MKNSLNPASCFAEPEYSIEGGRGIELSIIIPTYNESENLPVLISEIQEVMEDHSYEIIVVDDDSPDGTWQVAEQYAQLFSNISYIRRVNRKGLSSAITEGFLLAKGAYLAVLDADLQHDTRLIISMLEEIGEVDIVIGSRYVAQKSVPGWDSRRSRLSRAGTLMAQEILGREVSDPLSGFFMLHRRVIQDVAPELFSEGYKILFDILIRRPELRVKELQYEFQPRRHGTSKLNAAVAFDFADLLISAAFRSRLNLQLIRYGIAGASSVAAYFFFLYAFHATLGWQYPLSLALAIEAAVLSYYIMNNQGASRHRFMGSEWWKRAGSYNLICLTGSLCNFAIGWHLVSNGISWFLAGALGIWIGMSLNCLAGRIFTAGH
ncbi:MAG: glycosyltransferase [Syntrophobacteraceae bacterium]